MTIKVCHVTSAHKRYDVRIFEKECTSLSKSGYDVYLVVNDDKEDETINGVHIVSTGFMPRNRKERIVDSMSRIVEKAKSIDADIYHFHDPELMRIFSKIKNGKCKMVFDAHEDTQKQIMDKEWIPLILRKLVSSMYGSYQKKKMRKYDALITVTPQIAEKLKEYNPNVSIVTNYPIISQRKDAKILEHNDKYVFFAGGISEQWCHETIINAINNLNGIRYKLAGSSDENYFEKLKQCKGWEKVDFLGKIKHSEVEEIYTEAIAGMAVNECTQIKGEGTLGNTKLFEIMAASVPVVCTDYRLWKEIIETNKCGICVESNNQEQIADAINYLANNPEIAKNMGANGRKAVEETYNWATQEKELLDLYDNIINK